MTPLIEHCVGSGATQPRQQSTPSLPSWASSHPCRDPVEQSLISHSGESELAAFARDATRKCLRAGGRTRFSELLLIPIVSSGQVALADNLEIRENAQDPLVQQLIRLFPRDWSITFFRGIVPAEDLLGMSWQALRIYLDTASNTNGAQRTQTITRLHGRLPAGIPELGFIVVKAECDKNWPTELPINIESVNLNADISNSAALIRAAQILQLSAWESPLDDPDELQLLSPCGWSRAIDNGMRSWMRLLHARCEITGYALTLDPRDVDLCSLEICLANSGHDGSDTQPLSLHFGLRRYALTPQVWTGILRDLHAIAGETSSAAMRM